MQGKVSVTFVRLLHDFLQQRGFDATALLRVPRPPDQPFDHQVLPVDEWAGLLERANAAVHEPTLGLQIGALAEPAHLGLLGYLFLSCSNLGLAVHRFNAYERLIWDSSPGRVSLELRGIKMDWSSDMGTSNRLVDDCNLAGMVAFARNITGRADMAPTEVQILWPAPARTQPYEDFFRCPVVFGAPTNVVRVAYRTLLLPLRKADPVLHELLEAQARERLATLPPRDPFIAELQGILAGRLAQGESGLTACAQRLGCSARTLQRRLDEQGSSFQTVLDQTRERLADSYLADPTLKLSEVTLLLGYTDQAAFTRAFSRWKGTTPARWRAVLPQWQAGSA